MYKSLVFGDEFLAQGLHLKSHQRCSAGIRTWLSADQSFLPYRSADVFLFFLCFFIHHLYFLSLGSAVLALSSISCLDTPLTVNWLQVCFGTRLRLSLIKCFWKTAYPAFNWGICICELKKFFLHAWLGEHLARLLCDSDEGCPAAQFFEFGSSYICAGGPQAA